MRTHAILPVYAALAALPISSSAAHAATPKACDLLTSQTASSLLESPVKAPVDLGGVSCVYTTASGTGSATLMLVDQPGLTADDFKRSMATQHATTLIQGLGDAGFFSAGVSNQHALMVLYHQKMVHFLVVKNMTPALQTQMIQVMKQILAKI